jgi:hypothetical protein
MPLFRKSATVDAATIPGHAVVEDEFQRQLDAEVWRASRYGRPLAVVCFAPRLLAGEQLTPAERNAALDALRRSLRLSDFSADIGDSIVAAALPETGDAQSRAVASRLRSDLALSRAAGRQINWLVGAASLTTEETAEALLQTALNSMRT